MMKNYIKKLYKNNIFIFILIIIIGAYFNHDVSYSPAEDMDIPAALGVDILDESSSISGYSVPVVFYNYGTEPNITSYVLTGKGLDLSNTREDRQGKEAKKFILGLEKILISSEAYAEEGIKSWMNILYNNSNRNNNGYFMVCKGKSEDIFKLKIPGYPNASDYVHGIVKHSVDQNFMAKEYDLANIFIDISTKGRNIVVPYIDIKDDKPLISGMAIFDKFKMVRKIDINEAKYMNLLRENKVGGILSIYKGKDEFVDVSVKSNRKVTVSKENDKLCFVININLKGWIISNMMYENLYSNSKHIPSIQNEIAKVVEDNCWKFIEKMKNQYKVDCLNLGEIYVSNYGRYTDEDLNKIVCESDIKVNVNVKLALRGKGDFQ